MQKGGTGRDDSQVLLECLKAPIAIQHGSFFFYANRQAKNAQKRTAEYGGRAHNERRVWGMKVRRIGLQEARRRYVGRAVVGSGRKG